MPVMNCKSCGRLTSTATSKPDGCHVAVDGGVWVKGCAWDEKPKQFSDMYRKVVESKVQFPEELL